MVQHFYILVFLDFISFLSLHTASDCRTCRESLVLKMLSYFYFEDNNQKQFNGYSNIVQPVSINTAYSTMVCFSLNPATKIFFLTTTRTNADEVSNYLSLSFTESEISLLNDDEVIVEFSVPKREMFLKLHHIVLKTLVTPASLLPSERDFILLELLVNSVRSRLKDDTLIQRNCSGS